MAFSPKAYVERDKEGKVVLWRLGQVAIVASRTGVVWVGTLGVKEFQNKIETNEGLARVLANAALHEIGHMFGLPELTDPNDLMVSGEGFPADFGEIITIMLQEKSFTEEQVKHIREWDY